VIFFPVLVSELAERFPKLQLRLHEGLTDQLRAQLREGVLDAMLVALPHDLGETEVHVLAEDSYWLACPKDHPLANAPVVSGADLVFEDGAFRVAGTDRAVDLMALSEIARREGKVELLSTTREFTVPGRSYPNGAHFCEVEIEADTGRVDVVKYTVVDDFGYLINPMLAEGQVHGGVAQGIGQAITEEVAYDADGQLLSGSFMDYGLPRADDVPPMGFHAELVPSTANAIGSDCWE